MTDTSELNGRQEGAFAASGPSIGRRIWCSILGRSLRLSLDEATVSKRGFVVDQPDVRARFDGIGTSFTEGYNRAVASIDLETLMGALEKVPHADLGFAYEGAAMGLAISDWMTPGRHLFKRFVEGPAGRHEYMAWVGLGWSFARLPVSPMRVLSRYKSLNKWLALDGYGFHEGYFGWRRTLTTHRQPRTVSGEAASVFDQGLGRSLWFVCGANPSRVEEAIAAFDRNRRPDLWAGVGLAATYAGGVSSSGLLDLKGRAGAYYQSLAQGAVFAAQARRRAGNVVFDNESACTNLLGMPLNAAAEMAIDCLPEAGDELAVYQRWRFAIQARFG